MEQHHEGFRGHGPGLETLLELDGEIFHLDVGFWTKIEAKMVEPNEHIPHGIRYSLTLQVENNMRILGYDNAHGIKPGKNRFTATRTKWDHKHERNKIKTYEFESAGRLVEDFWREVNRILAHKQR